MTSNPVPSITPGFLDRARSFQLDIIKKALLACAAPALILVLLGLKSEARGLALGGLFSAIDFRLAGILTASRLRAGKTSRVYLSVAAKFALLAVPFFLAIKWETVSFVTTFIGIFSVKAVIFFKYVVLRRPYFTPENPLKRKG